MINVALKKRPQKRLGDKRQSGFGRGGKGKKPTQKAGAKATSAAKEVTSDIEEIIEPEDHHEEGALHNPAYKTDEPITSSDTDNVEDKDLTELLTNMLADRLPPELAKSMSPIEVTESVENLVDEVIKTEGRKVSPADRLDLQTFLLNEFFESTGLGGHDPLAPENKKGKKTNDITEARERIQPMLMEHIDASAAAKLPRTELADQVGDIVGELLVQEKINLNLSEQRNLVSVLLNEMLGLGPLEPLLADESITDIMVNGPNQVYIEQNGKLILTDVKFRDNAHLMNIATRIVTAVGRRVDETSPICDARLADGSRVNVIAAPLAIDGASISIRKFAKQKITLDKMISQGNVSPKMGTVLKIAAACQLNILISGGTGSGKTTMLNALSKMIDSGERIVTIEDAAELQLQQPHVVRLETRPANLEGTGEITMRDLVKNALRMRPDRIILGEIRGSEAIDMLQAMNTGHDGSLGTIHANRPREALTRLENMVGMAGLGLPANAIRTQIADALHLIVQVSRMRDGVRRVQYVTEVVGMEGDVVTTQDLFYYKFTGEDESGKLQGEFISTGVRPSFMEKAEYFGLARPLMAAMG
jgi:pilus assembly protein CpaF